MSFGLFPCLKSKQEKKGVVRLCINERIKKTVVVMSFDKNCDIYKFPSSFRGSQRRLGPRVEGTQH